MKWISVKDKLPKRNVLVLVGCSSKRIDERWVCCGQINDDGFWYNQWQDSQTDPAIFPTHWQKLPEPPTP